MKIVLLSFAFFLIPSQVGAASSGREVNNDWLDGRRLHELSELEVDKLLVEKRAVGSLADRHGCPVKGLDGLRKLPFESE